MSSQCDRERDRDEDEEEHYLGGAAAASSSSAAHRRDEIPSPPPPPTYYDPSSETPRERRLIQLYEAMRDNLDHSMERFGAEQPDRHTPPWREGTYSVPYTAEEAHQIVTQMSTDESQATNAIRKFGRQREMLNRTIAAGSLDARQLNAARERVTQLTEDIDHQIDILRAIQARIDRDSFMISRAIRSGVWENRRQLRASAPEEWESDAENDPQSDDDEQEAIDRRDRRESAWHRRARGQAAESGSKRYHESAFWRKRL